MTNHTEYITIPKGGRPKKTISNEFIIQLANDRLNMSIVEVCAKHNISPSTMHRYIRMGKERGIIKLG